MVSSCSSSLDGSFNISLNWGEVRSACICCIDCSSCSGEGGWDRSGMPGMLSRPERREESPSEEGGESEPPRMDVNTDVLLMLLLLLDLLRWKILVDLASDDAALDSS